MRGYWRQVAILIVVTVVLYGRVLGYGFVGDDWEFVEWVGEKVERVRSGEVESGEIVNELWRGDLPENHVGVYRPVRSMWYLGAYLVGGENPVVYHGLVLGVYVVGVVGVYFLLEEILRRSGFAHKSRSAQDDKSGLKSFPDLSIERVAFWGALLFAVQPMHVEAVGYVAGGFDMIGNVLGIWAVVLFLKANCEWRMADGKNSKFLPRRQAGKIPASPAGGRNSKQFQIFNFQISKTNVLKWLSLGLFAAGVLTYEFVLVVPVLLTGHSLLVENQELRITNRVRRVWKRLWKYFGVALIYWVVRTEVVGVVARGGFVGESPVWTMMTSVKAVMMYFLWLFLPLGPDLLRTIPNGIRVSEVNVLVHRAMMGQSFGEPFLWVAVGVILVVVWVVVFGFSTSGFRFFGMGGNQTSRRGSLVRFGLFWILVSLVPAMNIFPSAGLISDRYTFLASVGSSLVLAYGGWLMADSWRKFSSRDRGTWMKSKWVYLGLKIGLLMLTVVWGWQTWDYLGVWKNEYVLWEEMAGRHPDHAWAQYKLGEMAFNRGDIKLAEKQFEKSLEIFGEFSYPWRGLAVSAEKEGRLEEAQEYWERAVGGDPPVRSK